jgi:spore germination protein KB
MSFQLPEGHLGRREAIALLSLTILANIFLSLPQRLAKDGKNAAWLVLVIAAVLALIGLLFILALSRRFPGRTIVEAGEEAVGPFLGALAALGYFLFFTTSLILFLRQFSETIITAFLPRTPFSVVTGLFLIVTVYACYTGLEALSRTAGLFLVFILGSLLLITILLIPSMTATYNLLPFWGSGAVEVVRAGALRTSLFGEILLLGLIAPLVRNRDAAGIGIASLALAAGMMIFLEIFYLLIYPIPAATKIAFPLYSEARLVFIGRFVQRVDAIFVFFWIISGLIKLSAHLYASTAILARVLKLPVFRPLVFPLGILIYAITFTVPSFPDAVALDSGLLRTFGWIPAFLLPVLIYLAAVLRRKGGNSCETRENRN